MLVRALLTNARSALPWTYVQADWAVDQLGLENTDDLETLFSFRGERAASLKIEQMLSRGAPPAGNMSCSELSAAFLSRWQAFKTEATKPLVTLASMPSQPQVASAIKPPPGASPYCSPSLASGPAHGSSPTMGSAAPSSALAGPAGDSPLQQPCGVLQALPKKAVGKAKAKAKALPKKRPVGPAADLTFVAAHCAKQQKAIQSVSTTEGRERVTSAIRERLYAARTWASHLSEIKFYSNICRAAGVTDFPVSHRSLELFVGAMADQEYCPRSIPVYVSAVFRQQLLLWQSIPQEVRDYKSILLRAAKRGAGDAHRMLPITAQNLSDFRTLANFVSGALQMFLFRISVLTWYFLLRSDESVGSESFRGLSRDSIRFNHETREVTLVLGVTKTNTEGLTCTRSHFCVCNSNQAFKLANSEVEKLLPVCPYCSACLLVADSALSEPDAAQPLRPAPVFRNRPPPAPKSCQLLAFLRKGMFLLGFALIDAEGEQNYGTHSLRRGAAQALCAAGYTIETIKFFGRWLSQAVELYLLSVPVETFGHGIAASMLGTSLGGADPVGKLGQLGGKKGFSRVTLKAGSKVKALLPDLATPVDLTFDLQEAGMPSELNAPPNGWLDAEVLSILPALPEASDSSVSTELFYHESICKAFPHDFNRLESRTPAQRCALLKMAPEMPTVVVCFESVYFTVLY